MNYWYHWRSAIEYFLIFYFNIGDDDDDHRGRHRGENVEPIVLISSCRLAEQGPGKRRSARRIFYHYQNLVYCALSRLFISCCFVVFLSSLSSIWPRRFPGKSRSRCTSESATDGKLMFIILLNKRREQNKITYVRRPDAHGIRCN